jgi:hypothetical protein
MTYNQLGPTFAKDWRIVTASHTAALSNGFLEAALCALYAGSSDHFLKSAARRRMNRGSRVLTSPDMTTLQED